MYKLVILVSAFFTTLFIVSTSIVAVHKSTSCRSVYRYKQPLEKKIVALVPSRNNSTWCEGNLRSIYTQDYTNYEIIYIDDNSTDGTQARVDLFVTAHQQNHRTRIIANTERRYAMANIYDAVWLCKPSDIVVLIDGDDELSDNQVFSLINHVYNTYDIWITFGNFKRLSNNETLAWAKPFQDDVIKQGTFNKGVGLVHLRTFYAGLFHQIKKEDLLYHDPITHIPRWPEMAYDSAMFYPMINMAWYRHMFINQVLYVYNDMSSYNDYKVDDSLQKRLDTYFRGKEPYKPLSRLPGVTEN